MKCCCLGKAIASEIRSLKYVLIVTPMNPPAIRWKALHSKHYVIWSPPETGYLSCRVQRPRFNITNPFCAPDRLPEKFRSAVLRLPGASVLPDPRLLEH